MTPFEEFLKGGRELTEEEKKELTPEQLQQVKDKVLSEISALHQEKKRQKDLVEESKKEAQKEEKSFSQRLVEENTQKAEKALFSELASTGVELSEEKKQELRDIKKRLDKGSVTYENILEDYWAAYAVIERKKLFDDQRAKMNFEKEAAKTNAEMAGGQGGGGSTPEPGKVYPPEVLDMVREAKQRGYELTPEAAYNYLLKGSKRVHTGEVKK